MSPILGGSQPEWTEVVEILNADLGRVASDLTGFGAASNAFRGRGYDFAHRVAGTRSTRAYRSQ
ncbi:hypothetical protein [Granulicella aggregans]|uniref:hypothetical protein n=1 Tax=Granulicella aggregans TaxID=474949 RepID=UPI0021DFC089|nr:hypothetical protein [Granulicella aggregans]